MATAFSTADAAIIEHEVELDEAAVQATASASGRDVPALYDIEATADKLARGPSSGAWARVALQFPDEALVDAVPVFHALTHALKARTPTPPKLFILADTSYGSCCVDEVAASHVDADVVVHYGHTCMSVYVLRLTTARRAYQPSTSFPSGTWTWMPPRRACVTRPPCSMTTCAR